MPFQRLRSALHRNQPVSRRGADEAGSSGLLESADGGSVATPLALAGASPQYVEMVTEIQHQVASITGKMDELGRAHDARAKAAGVGRNWFACW